MRRARRRQSDRLLTVMYATFSMTYVHVLIRILAGHREKVEVPYEVGKERLDALKLQVSHGLEENGNRPGTSNTQRPGTSNSQRPGSAVNEGHLDGGIEPAVPDDYLLDAETKADIAKRANIVAEAGALHCLVQLCVGPEGPLADLEASEADKEEAEEAARLIAKRSKKGKKGKKKAKMEPGMAEAQTWASAVIRMISLDAAWGEAVRAAGAIRYLLPLLDSKIHPAR
ncbi:hypothetical protein DUNSADRAFT_17312 [Dunaliella salina]|uniref:Uncharacterized protein n=1 Tax=Dunaliella salina TaxID=3046 RepID=A0ABQ7G1Z9_DUNSA|nr:hypothetical protein DUNSADRAFT_17312 [Dunaliella salina]|eukprot:KAF5828623.1 hypothetical protein DUNSADRAFT_17312 [Dunaliella salina]